MPLSNMINSPPLCGEKYVAAEMFVEELHAQAVGYLLEMAYFFDLAVTCKQ